jgi:cytochrome c biogenesis protein CcdA
VQQNLVGLAFAAGLVAAVNPCGFALLPAYLTLVVRGDEGTSQPRAVGRALAATAAMALGFLAVFSTFGLLAVSVASTVQRYAPYVTVVIGIVLVALGIWLLSGRRIAGLNPFSHSQWEPTTRISSMFGYGVGYAMASLSCTVGPFLAVTGATFRGGPVVEGLLIYLAYGAGLVLIVGVLAVGVAFAESALVERLRRIVPYTNAFSGVLLVVVGLYVGYYGVYEVRLFNANGNPRDPVIAVAGRLQGAVAGWVHQHGAWPWVLLLAVVVVLTVVVSVWGVRTHRRSRPSGQSHEAIEVPTPVGPASPPGSS